MCQIPRLDGLMSSGELVWYQFHPLRFGESKERDEKSLETERQPGPSLLGREETSSGV